MGYLISKVTAILWESLKESAPFSSLKGHSEQLYDAHSIFL